MVTSILLYVVLLPVQAPLDSSRLQAGSAQPALCTPSGEEPGPLRFVRAEAADEESEEEDWDGQVLADHPLAEVNDVHLILPVRGSNGSPHLPLARDPRRFPRSPPQVDPLPADHGLRASTV